MSVARGPEAQLKKRGRAVAKKPTKSSGLPRERLAALRERAKLSVREVVQRLGYQSPSGYHRYEREDLQQDHPIPLDIVRRLIPHFLGRGQPPITAEEMMALTDVKEQWGTGVVGKYFTPVAVSEGSGIPIKYQIEPGKFIRSDAVETGGARSMVCAHALYGHQVQFVVGVRGPVGGWYARGDQLHCVDPSEFSPMSMVGRRVCVAAPYKGGDLVEIGVALVDKNGLEGHDGKPVEGAVLGVVIGVYRQE